VTSPAPAGELGAALAAWLEVRTARPVRVTGITRPSSGMSSDTVIADLDWGDRAERVVVRLPPTGSGLFPRYDLSAQVAVLSALASTDVPVPTVLWDEPDSAPLGRPFFVMQHVEGRIPPDGYLFAGWVRDLEPRRQRELMDGAIDVLARIHRVDVAGPGLQILDRPEHGDDPVAQETGWWRAYLEWAAAGARLPVLERAFAQLVAAQPDGRRVPRGLVWGDTRLGNLVVDDALRPVAVLDWEMAVLGPPELDVGWHLFLDRTARQFAPQLPGFPDPDGFVAAYEARAGSTLRDVAWWEAWSGFRTACIQVRMAQSAHDREHNPVTDALATTLHDLGS
jgi:aminoglycoside phosphotransferase (APT) family kinase protein